VIKFSFSGLDTSNPNDFKISFLEAIRGSIVFFLIRHRTKLDNYEELERELYKITTVRGYIEFAFSVIDKNKSKAFIIIDEYDHFANDLIANGTNLKNEEYKELIWANGVVRDFYETLKDNTDTIIDKIFITGVTPMMLDDVTSGFNMSNNLSLKEAYNEILGFTKEEVEFVGRETGLDKSLFKFDIEYLYNGYLFHIDGKNKLYNSSMVNYFFLELKDEKGRIKRIVDSNLKTDYGRIKMLLNKEENIKLLEKIIKDGNISAGVVDRFSIDEIHSPENFLSLLFYMGLVTIGKDEKDNSSVLKIPNYSIKTMYWGYMEKIIRGRNPKMLYQPHVIYETLFKMSLNGEYNRFFECFQEDFVSKISNRDLTKLSEKNIMKYLVSQKKKLNLLAGKQDLINHYLNLI
jgi:hypothetical protein